MTTKNRIHHVGIHDTGKHADYFSASYIKILLTDKAGSAKYYFKDFKTSRTFLFSHFTFHIHASNMVKT